MDLRTTVSALVTVDDVEFCETLDQSTTIDTSCSITVSLATFWIVEPINFKC